MCFPADAGRPAIYSKFNKVVCVIKTVVLADTDLNCFFMPLLYVTHTLLLLLGVMLLYDSRTHPRGPRGREATYRKS